ncbi:MAG TPA: hypothetical protein EYG28_08290 [Nitrospiria bacterium]|nr:hypothetical protein [Candidatus Manganitrophaceae bacterium]HIL35373.1 hypothetical protein [Candidatus Manganitrophaceae bacterium]
MDELIKGLSWIRKAPQDDGILKAIVIRPSVDVRKELQRCRLSPESGAEGEAWSRNCWLRFEDGSPHPDV